MLGEGASVVVLSASILLLGDPVLPPTRNLREPEVEAELDLVRRVARRARLGHVLSNCFGFGGGHSASLAFGLRPRRPMLHGLGRPLANE